MKRCAIFITNAFPFMMRYWMELFSRWEDDIDKVYIGMEKPLWEGTEDYVRKILRHPKIEVLLDYTVQFTGLSDLYKKGNEDTVFITHDDVFILEKGAINKYFSLAEQGKVVTPVESVYSPKDYIDSLVTEKLQCDPVFFLLYFFFASRKLLDKTSRYFSGGGWKKDEYCLPLDTVVNQDIAGDTGFKLALELMENKAEFEIVPHHENTTYYLPFHNDPLSLLTEMSGKKTGLYSADWIHIMSMANTFKQWFGLKESMEPIKNEKPLINGAEIRLGWLLEFMDCDSFDEISAYRDFVKNRIGEIITDSQVSRDNIQKYKDLFHKLMWR